MTPAAHLQDVSSSEAEDVVIFVEREAAEVVTPLQIDLEGRRATALTRLAAWPAAAAAGACSQEPSDAAELKCLRRLPL